jgi:hypothetical protein
MLIRVLLVCLLSFGALRFVVRAKPESERHSSLIKVTPVATPLYSHPNRERRLTAIARLSVGAIVAGAVFAIFVSVAIAYIVGTVTNLLQ